MNRSVKHIFTLYVIAVMASLSSCNPIDDGGDEPKPEPEEANTVVIDGTSYEIKSAGCYYDVDGDGYDIVFSTEEVDLSTLMPETLGGIVFAVDIPGCDMGIKSNLPTIIQGDNWGFFFAYSINGKWQKCDGSRLIQSSSIRSGSMTVSYVQSKLDMAFSCITNGNVSVEVKYSGSPTVAKEYIWN